MKNFLAAAAFVTVGSASAFAADLPVKGPPVLSPAPAYSWTGFYVGGHVGAGWGTTETDADVGALINSFLPTAGVGLNLPVGQLQMNGFLGGAQAGHNWQSGMMVYGVEGDFTWSGLKGGTACLVVLHCDAEVKWIGDITGRVGVTVGDRGLVYIKGGVAWADSRYLVSQNLTVSGGLGAAGVLNGAVSDTRIGGTLGAGLEYGFMPGWSAKLEYDYFDFGKANFNMPITASGAIAGLSGGPVTFNLPISVTQQIHTIRAGVNYHFDSPLVAKF